MEVALSPSGSAAVNCRCAVCRVLFAAKVCSTQAVTLCALWDMAGFEEGICCLAEANSASTRDSVHPPSFSQALSTSRKVISANKPPKQVQKRRSPWVSGDCLWICFEITYGDNNQCLSRVQMLHCLFHNITLLSGEWYFASCVIVHKGFLVH